MYIQHSDAANVVKSPTPDNNTELPQILLKSASLVPIAVNVLTPGMTNASYIPNAP